ncbi:leucine export protein LeuE [bacterium BMS3Abin04]|nr:leucine export protein LeuE [bacterium BMS3Abin04]
MLESIITLAVVGFLAGVIFSIPVAGPVSIIIISKALEGKLRFCERTALGASIVEFFYVFIVVYGIAALISFYAPIIPYLLLIGALFVVYSSINIMRRKLDFKQFGSNKIVTDKMENSGGMRTGLILNLTNPALFIGWLVAAFITLSFVSSLGLNTGGLDVLLNENVNSVSKLTGSEFKKLEDLEENNLRQENNKNITEEKSSAGSTIFLTFIFALSVALGALIWLIQLARFMVKHRDKIRVGILNRIINGLGLVLFFIGGYLGFKAIQMFFN